MKRLAVQKTIVPEGWKPKPPKTHHHFLDWCIAHQQWLIYIQTENYKYRQTQNPTV